MDLVNIFIARDKCHQTCSFHEASQHFPLFLNFLQIQQARGLRGPISDFGTYFVNLYTKVGGSYCGPRNILRVVCLEYKIWCKAHTHQAVHITYFKMTTKSDDIWFSLYDIFTVLSGTECRSSCNFGATESYPNILQNTVYSVHCTVKSNISYDEKRDL